MQLLDTRPTPVKHTQGQLLGQVQERLKCLAYQFHDLRHTAASLMLNHGVPVLVVSRILGHANPSITLNTYAHLYDENAEQVARLMDELVSPQWVELFQQALECSVSGLRDKHQ